MHKRNFMLCDKKRESGMKEREEEDKCDDGYNFFLHRAHKGEERGRD